MKDGLMAAMGINAANNGEVMVSHQEVQTGGAPGAGYLFRPPPSKVPKAERPLDLSTIVKRLRVSLPVMRAA